MSSSKQSHDSTELPFSKLLVWSLGLVFVSLVITFFGNQAWTWFGRLSGWVFPISILIAVLLFWLPVVLVSHRWLRLSSFYALMSHLHDLTRSLTWPQIFMLSCLAGLGEELLFRGFLQSWLSVAIGVYTAIILSSLIFALLHAMTLYYFAITFLLSLVFAVLFQTSQSMLLVVLIHAVYDVIALGVIAKYPHLVGLDRVYENPGQQFKS